MKTILAVLMLMPLAGIAQETVDGPYVFYHNDSAFIKNIIRKGDLLLPDNQLRTSAAIPSAPIAVNIADQPSWNFTVVIQKELITPPVSYPAPQQLFVLSDIEGEFAAGRQLLLAAHVMDEHYNWTFGKGHLVIAGDLFDRGTEVLPWLWLLYSLEEKAQAAGGFVHVILGNHDIMQLSGDFRYTDARYFKNAWIAGRDIRTLFGEDTELGRWLRSKNIIEKVGDLLVMHAGLSPQVLQKNWDLATINTTCRPYYASFRKGLPDSLKMFFDSNAPFWYRGYFMEPKATTAEIDSTLQLYDCKKIIVGHTITDTAIVVKYNGKVIGVDVNQHEGHHAGLLVEDNKYYQIDGKGNQTLLIQFTE